jgi:hypothetical protein
MKKVWKLLTLNPETSELKGCFLFLDKVSGLFRQLSLSERRCHREEMIVMPDHPIQDIWVSHEGLQSIDFSNFESLIQVWLSPNQKRDFRKSWVWTSNWPIQRIAEHHAGK